MSWVKDLSLSAIATSLTSVSTAQETLPLTPERAVDYHRVQGAGNRWLRTLLKQAASDVRDGR